MREEKKRERRGRDCERMEGGLGRREAGERRWKWELLLMLNNGSSCSNLYYLTKLLL